MGSEVTFPSLDEISGLKNNTQDFDADVEAIPAPWPDYVAFAFENCDLEELPDEYLQKASETYEYCSVPESTSLVFEQCVRPCYEMKQKPLYWLHNTFQTIFSRSQPNLGRHSAKAICQLSIDNKFISPKDQPREVW